MFFVLCMFPVYNKHSLIFNFGRVPSFQMLYEFMRYKTLLDRPIVKRLLNSELEIFVLSLDSMLKEIKAQLEFEDAADVKMYRPPEMSSIVQQVQWAKQMEAKVQNIHFFRFHTSSRIK